MNSEIPSRRGGNGRYRSNFLRTIEGFACFDVEALSRCVLGRGKKSAKAPRF
jgi:hypothetical protein